jgi:hypothetical protein
VPGEKFNYIYLILLVFFVIYQNFEFSWLHNFCCEKIRLTQRIQGGNAYKQQTHNKSCEYNFCCG